MSVGALLGIVGALVAAAAFYILLMPRMQDTGMANDCRAQYQRAHSATDTATIDARPPWQAEADATTTLSCGELRHRGLIAP